MGGSVTGLRLHALAAAAQGRVDYRLAGRGRSLRVWHCGDPAHDAPHCTYTVMTAQVAWLHSEGLVRLEGGYRYGRGIVEATPAGRGHLNGRMWSTWRYLAGWR
jgi:hypothetical protein